MNWVEFKSYKCGISNYLFEITDMQGNSDFVERGWNFGINVITNPGNLHEENDGLGFAKTLDEAKQACEDWLKARCK